MTRPEMMWYMPTMRQPCQYSINNCELDICYTTAMAARTSTAAATSTTTLALVAARIPTPSPVNNPISALKSQAGHIYTPMVASQQLHANKNGRYQ